MKIQHLCILTSMFVLAPNVLAQQSTNMPSATQPGVGSFLFQSVTRYAEYDKDPTTASRDIQQTIVDNWLAYGATPNLSFMINLPYEARRTENDLTGSTDHTLGFGDLHAMAKYRIYQNDTGPIDTARLSLTTGLDLPTGDGPYGGDSFDPMIGAVYTQIKSRHGFNASLRYTIATSNGNPGSITPGDGGHDLLRYDAAYLYRLSPRKWSVDSKGGLYAMFEANGFYETNGDHEILLAPGLMWEAPGWVIESSLQLPAWQELDDRPHRKFVFSLGFRILF